MNRLLTVLVLALGVVLAFGCKPATDKPGEDKTAETSEKVAVDFHIMSKCPFGVKVVDAIAPVLDKMGENVDFNLHYIGKVDPEGKFNSLHGEQEVQGNILQLCAHELGDNATWLNFLNCQNKEWRKIPEGWEACAETAKLDVAKMKACYEGDQGKQLLTASFKLSEEKKASGSPTIFVAEQPYRGGRSEQSFARAICGKYTAKPGYCQSIPEPVKIPVTVVADKRCQGRGCDPKRFLSFVGSTFEGADIKELDWDDPAAKELFQKSGEKFLPIAVFGPDIQKEETGYNRLKRRLKKMEGSEDMVYPLGRDWDPNAEICDDGADNTGNGKVDCADESCNGKKVCRDEVKNKLDVFVMSQCPYGVRTVDAMKGVIDNFKKDRGKMDFELNYIGNEKDGQLTSMHGPAEVDENIRQLCAQKHYKKDYKFMEYVYCRNKDYRNPAWEACATGGIKADVIRKCAEGDEGKGLLSASYKKANALGISGSPNWLLNNRFDMNARDPEAIKKAFCAKNEGTAGCENTLESSAGKPVPAGACGS